MSTFLSLKTLISNLVLFLKFLILIFKFLKILNISYFILKLSSILNILIHVVLLSNVHAMLSCIFCWVTFPSTLYNSVIISLCIAFFSNTGVSFKQGHRTSLQNMSSRSLGISSVPGKVLCWFSSLCFLYLADHKSSENHIQACSLHYFLSKIIISVSPW